MRARGGAHTRYRVPAQHRVLLTLIDTATPGCRMIDPINNVLLACDRSGQWRTATREVRRVRGSEIPRIAARMQAQPRAGSSVVLLERFLLASRRRTLFMTRRMEPLEIGIHRHGRLIDATQPTRPPSRRERRAVRVDHGRLLCRHRRTGHRDRPAPTSTNLVTTPFAVWLR